ncbi:hypothetical protein [Photobacterium marinum]|nr:hypothetical protein [Photobacterium marinum]
MINDANQLDFVRYFQKRLLDLDSRDGAKFKADYEEFTQSRLTRDKAHHLSVLLDNAFGDVESQKLLEDWAEEHVSPSVRKRFLTAQRQKKAKAKRHLVTLEATPMTRLSLQSVVEMTPELKSLKQAELVELLLELAEYAITYANKDRAMAGEILLEIIKDKLRRATETQSA